MIIKVEITGITPLLMNKFSVDKGSVKVEKNATPREIAKMVCYEDDEGKLYLPSNNIYSCLIESGKFHKLGKNKVTTMRSSLIPAGIMIQEKNIYFDKPDKWEVDSRAVVVPATGGRIVC